MGDLLQRVADLERKTRGIPSRFAGGGAPAAHLTAVIVGGNAATIGNGLDGIAYTPDPITPTAAFDPEVDTVLDDGLGVGILYRDGIRQPTKVLIRHNFVGVQFAVLTGMLVRIVGTTVLNYDPGGGDPVVPMTAYLFDFV